MDSLSFVWVSGMAAVGGAIGTFVGFRKLAGIRQEELVVEKANSVVVSNPQKMIIYTSDFARTLGYLGAHSIYGMVVYPWMPLYLLGNAFRVNPNAQKRFFL